MKAQVQSSVGHYINTDTCSPFVAYRQHVEQEARKVKTMQRAGMQKMILSPAQKMQQALEIKRKSLFPSQIASANTLNLR